MSHIDLGACEQFVSELRRSNLVERGQLDQLLENFARRHPRPEIADLADYFVAQQVLTPFQIERVAAGQSQGLVLGPYVLTESVGSGSMGFVYKATSKNDRKTYAVKVLPRRSMWNVRLARRQVRAFGQFSHPSVVPFVDVGTAGGLHYLVWDFVEGENLETVVEHAGQLDPAAVARIGLQVAEGLSAALDNGLFHGLLKPSNIMISPGGKVRILDFGIGSLLAENEGETLVDTMSTANALTSGLNCASPESIREPTNRTPAGDQYGLGCVLYFCVTGRYPFADGNAVDKMMAHQFKQPIPVAELVPGTPTALGLVIDRLMQKLPEDRYPNIADVFDMLGSLAAGSLPAVIAARPLRPTPSPGVIRPQSPRPAPATPRLNPALLPASHRGERLPGSRALSLSAPARPAPTAAPPSPLKIPTRRELLGDEEPPTVVQQKPRPSPLEPATVQSATPPTKPTGRAPWTDEPRRMFGPVGFLGIAATIAVACYLVASYILN